MRIAELHSEKIHRALRYLYLVFLSGVVPLSCGRAAVVISTDPTQNMSCSGGVCVPTASDAVLNVSDVEDMLAAGDLTVATAGSGVDAEDIDVKTAFSWSAGSTLSLDASLDIAIDQAISSAVTG